MLLADHSVLIREIYICKLHRANRIQRYLCNICHLAIFVAWEVQKVQNFYCVCKERGNKDGRQWRTEGGFGVFNPPPTRNSEDIGGVLDRMSKKNRRLDFLL